MGQFAAQLFRSGEGGGIAWRAQWHQRGVPARTIPRVGRGDYRGRGGRVIQDVGDDKALIEFVYHEARLIDEKRFDEWYDLYAEDGRYWMPLMGGQPEGAAHHSLF